MANTLTISISHQDQQDLKENPSWSASKIFRSAMKLQRKMDGFTDIYCLEDYIVKILQQQEKFPVLQSEILKREEKIESLKNVLEEKIVAERRLRKTEQGDSGSGPESGALKDLRRESRDEREELAWPRKQKDEWGA